MGKANGNAYFIPKNEIQLQILLTLLDLHEKIHFEPADKSKSFLVEKRILQDDSILVFMSNQEGGEHKASLYYQLLDKGDDYMVQTLNLETGQIDMLHAETEEESIKVSLHFSPYQSHLIQITRMKNENEAEIKKEKDQFIWNVKANEAWQMKPLQDNIIRFDTFELKVKGDQEAQYTNSGSEVHVKTFIDQCADLSEQQKLPLAFHQVFGTPMKMNVKYPLSCTYEKIFEIEDLPGYCFLLMDKEAISGEYLILINDPAVSEFKNQFVYDHRNQTCDITALLQKGQNTLRVNVTLHHDGDGVVDPLCLLGHFGVTFDSRARPVMTKIDLNAMTPIQHGPLLQHPYYAGKTLLRREELIENIPLTDYFTLHLSELDRNFHDCLEVIVNGYSLGERAWTPYQWEFFSLEKIKLKSKLRTH